MDAFITRYFLSILLLTVIRLSAGSNETTQNEPREPRVSGRIVKLYSGAKPESYLCSGEGFQPDPSNCAVFYRCVKERSGKFTVFRYQCAPGTVYDPDVEICNHPHNTRRAECGGMLKTTAEPRHTSNINEIDGPQPELPRPISTKVPIYTEQTTLKNPTSLSWILSTESQSIPTKIPWRSPNTPSSLGAIQHKTTKFSGITTEYLWSAPTQYQVQTSAPTKTQQSSSQYNDPCTSDGFMGDSENCRKFYRCVGNHRGGYVKYEFSCSESTVWDDEIQGCNHPWAVKRSKCGRSMTYNEKYSSQKPSPNPIKGSAIEQMINNGGFGYKSNETIQQQLQISHGSQVTQTQTQISNSDQVIQNQTQVNYGDKPEKNSVSKQNQTQISHGTAVSQTQTQIDYGNKGVQTQLQIDHSKDSSQSQVQIQESTTAQSATSVQNHNVGINECSESGFMGDVNDCTKFYRCVENGKGRYIKFQYNCGDGTVWDPEIEACNHAWSVKNCGGKLPPKPTSEGPITTTKSTEFHVEPTKTTQSYYSTSQVTDVNDVDDVGYGNQINQETISSVITMKPTTITTLNPSTTIKSTTSTTEKSNAATIDCTSSGFIGDANDCKIFYRCVDNARGGFTKYEFKCGDGTLWDPDIEACNHAWAVKNCGGSTSGNVEKEETTTKKEDTTYPQNVQTTITLIQVTTQASTLSDDYDTGYGSQNHEVSTTILTTKQPQVQESGKNNECKSSGFMGDDNDCKKFYRCVDNGSGGYIRYEFACGEGTVWDPKIEACNHAWAVEKCGGSNNMTANTETTSQSISTAGYVDTSSAHTTQGHKDTDGPIVTTTSSTTSSATTSSSTSNKCSKSGFMGDDNDCKKFYRCVDNGDGNYIRYEFTCGEGTVWDPKIEACNHAWAVEKCGGSNNMTENTETTSQSIPTAGYVDTSSAHTTQGHKDTDGPMVTTTSSSTSSATTSSSTSNECQKSGFMSNDSDCKKFYRCVDNGDGTYIRYEFTCGDGTVWDSKIEACNHAWAVEKCGGSSESTYVTQPTTSQNPVMQDEQENGYATPSFETSEPPHISTSSTSSSSSSAITSNENDRCNKDGFMSDKKDCKKFYRCVDNGKGGYDRYEFQCGEGTVWDANIEACNHAWAVKDCGEFGPSTIQAVTNESTTQSILTSIANADQIQQSTEKTTTTTQSEVAGGKCTQEGFFSNKQNCKMFYRCVNNGKGGFTKYEFTCGEGTKWNQEIQGCDHADLDIPCGVMSEEPTYLNDDLDIQATSTTKTTSSTEKNENTLASEKPQISQGSCDSEGFYENPSDCMKFYRCVANGNGGYTKYDFNCGDGTVWNQEIQACDHESADKTCSGSFTNQNQGTESQTESTTSSHSTTKRQETSDKTNPPEAAGSICTSEGFFSHPYDCKKFIRCVNNDKGGYTKYEFSCGDGTIWVQNILACDHDNDVNSCSAQSESSFKPPTTVENSSNISDSSVISSTESMTPIREDDEYDAGSSKEPSHDESADCTSEGYFANKQDCRRFYRCVDNGNGRYTKYDFVCGEGTAWDPELKTCNHINEVQSCTGTSHDGSGNHQTTTNKNQAETENTPSTTKATTLSLESSGGSNSNSQDTCKTEGYFGDSKDCTKFYRCVNNGKGGYTKYDFTCGDGTIWDQDITNCNHPQDVSNPSCSPNQGASESSSTTSSTTSSSSQTISSTTESNSSSQGTSDCSQESSKKPANTNVTCDKAGFYANPNDCKKFYRCVDWDGDGKKFSVFHFECGEGTIWDPTLDTCNHEDSVYPQRDCSQTMGGETSTTEITTTSTTTTKSTTSEQTITQQPTTSEETTTQQYTISEPTTTEQSSSEQTSTEQTTTSDKSTTQDITTSEQTTTQQSPTSEKTTTKEPAITEETTTQQSTTSEQTTIPQSTTEQSTNEQTTTHHSTTIEKTTTQESITTEPTTTQQSTTSEQATTQQSTTSDQTTTQESTTSEQTTTQQSSTSDQTTTQESTTSEQTTTQQSTTSDQSTTQESTTSEQTTTQQYSTSEQTNTNPSTTSEYTTTEQSTNEQTTIQQSTTSEKTTTQEQTTSEQITSTTQQSTTSEQTITQESTTIEQTTTLQSNEQTTKESTTTTEQTTESTSTTEESTNQSTTHTSSTEFDSTEDQSTTESAATTEEVSSSDNCPEIEDDQYLLVCPTSFKRHPKYCNMFYQCTEDDDTYEAKVAMFKCPNNTIYDENQTQCVTEDKTDKKCDGEIADKRRFKRLDLNNKDPIMADKGKQSCSSVGYFSFEKNSECSKGFLKCKKSNNGQIKGHVYQCPDGYIYWSISKRCERTENVRDCKRSSNDWSGRWNIPVERKNIATS